MSLRANLVMALRGISSNWLRSLLTMLGVLIGVAAVIVLLAVGTGSSRAVEARIDQLGTNTLTVFNSGRFGRGTAQTGTQSRNATLTLADVKLISEPEQRTRCAVGLTCHHNQSRPQPTTGPPIPPPSSVRPRPI